MRLLDSENTLRTLTLALLVASVLAFAQPCSAATPNVIGYQGRVLVGGVPFNPAGNPGTGNFRFALVDGNTIVWNSTAGASSAAPTADISIPVSNGLYSVLIGNTAAGNPIMAPLPANLFSTNNPLSLRVYFSDTGAASQALVPDQPIAAVGYSQVAASVVGGTATFTGVGNLVGVTSSGTDNSSTLSVSNTSTSNTGEAIFGANFGTGYGVRGRNSGNGTAGLFENNTAGNPNPALVATTAGTGSAGSFSVNNTANNTDALLVTTNSTVNGQAFHAIHSGTGNGAGSFENTNPNNQLNTLFVGNNSTVAANFAVRIDATGSAGFIVMKGAGGTVKATINSAGAYAQSSDARLKTNITLIPHALQKIQAIRGVSYDWKDNRNPEDKHDVGVIAQEVLPVLPEAVSKGSNGFYSVAYSKLIPVLVEAVKELNTRHEQDNRKIASLEKQNAAMEARMARMEKMMEEIQARTAPAKVETK